MLSFLVSPFAKIIGVLALLGTLAGLAKAWEVQHDAAVVARVAAAETAARLAVIQADDARTISALQERANEAEARAATLTKAREAVASAPNSSVCSKSGPVRAALGGLRNKPASGHSGPAPSHPGAT